MKLRRLPTLMLFCIVAISNCFTQGPCEVFCTATNQLINVCTVCDNVIAADDCADAASPSICELDGFRTTICGGTPDGPDEPCGPGTSYSNNIWIGFTPVIDGRVHLQIDIIECLSTDQNCSGMQASLVKALCLNPGNDIVVFEPMVCLNCTNQTFDLITLDAVASVPHYLILDQCCEDVCEIQINVIEGLPVPNWELTSVIPSIVTNVGDPDCLDETSSITATAEPGIDGNPNSPLVFTWFDPDNEMIFRGPPNVGTNSSMLTGINPNTGSPYICKRGIYNVEVNDISTCCSDKAAIDTEIEPTAVQNLLDEDIVNIFPNPTSDFLNVQFLERASDLENIQIFNNKGKSVKFDIDAKNNSIDLTNLQSGFYILRIVLKDGSFTTKKIIKI